MTGQPLRAMNAAIMTGRYMIEALRFAADGIARSDSELPSLTAIHPLFERMAHGDVPSHVVRDFASH